MEFLQHEVNPFNGVVITTAALPDDAVEFSARLAHSLVEWTAQGRALIWLDLPIARADLVPLATGQGFRFHHTTEESLTLTYRVQSEALIPGFATHFIGAGGVVLTPERELLVVNERHRRDKSRPYWKLPGGALHPGEHLAEGVIREVMEETSVQAKFEALVCFRHWHNYRFTKSDIYFVCRLSAASRDITVQPQEIDEACWMPVDEYLANEYVGDFNKRVVAAAVNSPGIPLTWVDGYADRRSYEFFVPGGIPITPNPLLNL